MFATHLAIIELLLAIPSSGICGSKGVNVGDVYHGSCWYWVDSINICELGAIAI
jgi:hypothetical protein